ncbi:hypothetical protein CS022_15955 [Veronia nyctiphanis]|uniref:UPF0434 protein CS022_15955 n=1 Tax=Veronia nyctiphanis TaxID=1278244 RepID=A0A4V1LSP6_9GAMM|nr:Trm112 family protein [Veronia nyctiphanis]RXJ72428.1 hypothetical protein CS022_15955 [Veronia nyctiphanis]
MDHRLHEILACPICKGKLKFNKETNELICTFDRLAYPIRDGIPVLLSDEAREMTSEEVEK